MTPPLPNQFYEVLPENASGSSTPDDPPRLQQQTLLIDADDTLWENNIYFERAIASFISYLDHRVHTPEEVRERLNHTERATVAEHGYGLKSFRKSLIRCFEDLTREPLDAVDRFHRHSRIEAFANSIAEQQIELMPGVAHALPELSSRHRLLLVTKGDEFEQKEKLDRSGLAACFAGVEVLQEKHEAAYRLLIVHHGCDTRTTWMIGNSPKSDINPALAAGLNAIFVPHDFTWVLEHETINPPPSGQRLLEIATFSDLLDHF